MQLLELVCQACHMGYTGEHFILCGGLALQEVPDRNFSCTTCGAVRVV